MTIRTPPTRPGTDLPLLLGLYVAELAFLVMALSIHRKGDRSLAVWILTTPGLTFQAAFLGAFAMIAFIARRYARHRASHSRTFVFVVAMNLIAVGSILVPTEVLLRMTARRTADSRSVAGRMLFPRSWDMAAAHGLHVSEQASTGLSFLVYDNTLGWTVGQNRRSANGMYLSSVEGLRAASQGSSLAGPKRAPRVALVGDSFVFAEQVRFEDSWGHLLETNSTRSRQILNFGVGGYGLDQAYLRFKKDALPWNPDIVVLGFPFADLIRSLTVYPFIEWPDWDIPFSKPRLTRDRGGIRARALNMPTLTPSAMFRRAAITDLPFLEYEIGYRRHEWSWSLGDSALLKRLLFGFFPPRVEKNPHVSDNELVELNGAILRDFIRVATEHRVLPIIAYFPGKPEIIRLKRGEATGAQRILKQIGLPFVDTTPCVLKLDPDDAYVAGDPHYSPRGNIAVAECLAAALDQSLDAGRATRSSASKASHMSHFPLKRL